MRLADPSLTNRRPRGATRRRAVACGRWRASPEPADPSPARSDAPSTAGASSPRAAIYRAHDCCCAGRAHGAGLAVCCSRRARAAGGVARRASCRSGRARAEPAASSPTTGGSPTRPTCAASPSASRTAAIRSPTTRPTPRLAATSVPRPPPRCSAPSCSPTSSTRCCSPRELPAAPGAALPPPHDRISRACHPIVLPIGYLRASATWSDISPRPRHPGAIPVTPAGLSRPDVAPSRAALKCVAREQRTVVARAGW